MSIHHVVNEVERTISRSLRTEDRAAPFQSLAGQRSSVELRCQPLVLSEEIADLTTAHTDVTGGHVHIRTDNLIEFSHKRLAEAHDFCIALASWSEV